MILKRDMYYEPAGENRTLHIYLPDEYEGSNERYPVMYMFDGQNLFFDSDATYGTSWGLKDFLDHWDKRMMLVGMECSHTGDDRLSEYSPYDKRMFGHFVQGRGEATMTWLVHEVKPLMDRDYRTWSHREATGIGGSSMGGLMSLYAVIRYNDVFSKAAALSTGVFWNLSNLRRDLEWVQLDGDTKVYMSWGEIEMGRAAHQGNPATDTREARSVLKFEKELQEHGARTLHYFQWDGRHCEADWAQQDGIFMNWLWQNRLPEA